MATAYVLINCELGSEEHKSTTIQYSLDTILETTIRQTLI